MTEAGSTELRKAAADLMAVRAAVDQRRNLPMPRSVAVISALYVLVSYPLLDFRPPAAGLAFTIGAVICAVLSSIFGRRDSIRQGQIDRREAKRSWLHFSAIPLGVVAVLALGLTQPSALSGQGIGQVIVIVVGIVYFLNGVHFDRQFLWLGPLLMVGAIAVGFIPRYPWTALGLVIALGLTVPTFLRRQPVQSNEQQ